CGSPVTYRKFAESSPCTATPTAGAPNSTRPVRPSSRRFPAGLRARHCTGSAWTRAPSGPPSSPRPPATNRPLRRPLLRVAF
ncbi:MAG: hypothetical protein AVDCRST_MAG53-494, partial [uncultured Solirubrobacteraceae bacterium]